MKKFYDLNTPLGTTEKVYLKKHEYLVDKTLAVSAICENEEPWTVVTVNIGEKPLNEKCAFVKDYSENKGIANFLVENKIAKPTGRVFPSGFDPFIVMIPEYEFDLSKLSK